MENFLNPVIFTFLVVIIELAFLIAIIRKK